tara:strand:+ start:11308 stop:12102 length:795 start_codon:yes stop_codon:yes gene_type:complete
MATLLNLSRNPEECEAARARLAEREAQFVNPRWDTGIQDYVETNCLTCDDLGRVCHDVDVNHTDFGKCYPCPDCGGGFDRTANLLKHSGIQATQMKTFANFKRRNGTEDSIKAMKEFGEGSLPMLMVYGLTGCGKTHLAQATARQLVESGQKVKFVICTALLLNLKQGYRDEFDFADRMQRWIQEPILILDELKWNTSKDQEILSDLLCQREFAEVRTLVTSNIDYSDLKEVLPRVMSRFSDPLAGKVIWNESSDYRTSRKHES